MKSTNYLAALVLFFLPAISVELLTGDTPLPVYLNPITFIILNLTYGATLLLIRETVVRWGKGFASVLILAAGYGMVNEGIDTKGVFAPHFYAVVGSGLEGFGRHFGINIPWALDISIFHAVFSIIVPLVIVSAIFSYSSGPWIGTKLYTVLLAAVVACSIFSFKVLSLGPDYYHYNEGPGPILLILTLMAALIFLAWKLPPLHPHRWHFRIHPIALFVLGYIFTVAFNIPSRVQAATHSPSVYVLFLLIFFVALPIWLLFKMPQSKYGKLALVTGLLMPMMIASMHAGRGGLVATGILLVLITTAFWQNSRGVESQHHVVL